MENYKNLNFSAEQINQKLAWVGDKSKLATTLQETPVNQFMFTKDQKTLKTIIDANNQVITVETNDMITEPGSKLESWNVYVDHLLCINSIACEGTMCSHNYVELGNGSKKDINLNGLYLLYTDCSKGLESDIGYVWQYLPLTGVIKAGSTFVIRGRQTNTIKGSMIKVDSYDMEWDIEFKQNKAAFYLCAGDSFKPLLESNSLGNPWEANLIGYIDSCGAEGNSPLLVNDNWNDIIFVRWFMFETAKQGTKAFAKRKTKEFPTGCEKCIVYTHDAPFSIVTYDFMNTSTTARAGSKLNTINNNGTYRFSRLFKKMGIRLVMAGHKHTYGISKPIYDAPIEYLEGNKASSAVDILSGENTAQHKPMYIKYDVSDTNIKITAVQINGIWEVDSSSTKYDFNNQIENLTIDKMTLSTSTEEDLAIYSPDNQNFYTLKLQ